MSEQGRAVLITGPARSGKTAHCLRICRDAMRTSGPGRVLYLVPSAEAVRETERLLLMGDHSRAILGSVVTDFVGLASRILKKAGCFPPRRIGPLEKSYLILRIIRDTPLPFFDNVKDYDGFAQVVGDFIAELKRGMIPPERFLQGCLAAAGPRTIARDKVLGLHAIYSAYQDALKARDAYDGDGLQWMAAEALAANRSPLSTVEVLIVDGFATYTPVEMEMLALLVKHVPHVHITLCYKRDRPGVYEFVKRTYQGLGRLCEGKETALTRDGPTSKELLHLERNLFGERENPIPAGSAISIVRCKDVYREVETVARHIEKTRSHERLDYSDFMVILRDIGEYFRPICEVFAERRIPLSIPGSARLGEEPFIRSVVSTLRLAKGKFRSADVVAALKNSYIDRHPEAAAAIESYVDEFGLWDEELFRQVWTQTAESTPHLALLDAHKTRFLKTLDRLRAEAANVSSAEQFRDLVYRAIAQMGFLHRGAGNDNTGDKAARPQNGRSSPGFSDYRCLGTLASLLESMCAYARFVELPGADYSFFLDMLERGLSYLPIPPAPRTLNSVRVASIVGGPPGPAPVVFICGLCERSFPREIVNEPFLKDRERRLINRRGNIALDERLPLSSGERFFFYTAVSRATRKLVLTYPATDSLGEELVPSHYVEEVATLFSDLKDAVREQSAAVKVAPDFGDITQPEELRSFIADQFSRSVEQPGEQPDEGQTLALLAYNELIPMGDLQPNHLVYDPPAPDGVLSPEVCKALKKHPYPTSVSELETFARCPFRHFCEYTLDLKEAPRYQFSHREEGILYHEVLARLYREIYPPPAAGADGSDQTTPPGPRGIESIPEDERSSRLRALVDAFVSSRYARLFQTSRMEVRRRAIQARIEDFLLKETENERANATRPSFFELSFGRGRGGEGADARSTNQSLALGGEGRPAVLLSGRMDRVDVLEDDDERFGVVLDYKRSGQRTKPDLKGGTILQAGLYMLALKNLFNLSPAGAFYYSISSGRKRGVFAAEEEERISGKGDVSRNDKVSYQEIGDLMQLNAAQALDYVRRILHGDIGVTPADLKECRTCPFATLCRISERE